MRSFCLLTSMEAILISNCSLLYLHSIDMNSLNCYKNPQIKMCMLNSISIVGC